MFKKVFASIMIGLSLLGSVSTMGAEMSWKRSEVVPANQKVSLHPENNCVPSSIVNAIHYLSGDNDSSDNTEEINNMRQLMEDLHMWGRTTFEEGFYVEECQTALTKLGYSYKASKDFSLDALKKAIDEGVIIYFTNVYGLEKARKMDELGLKIYGKGYHAVTIIGYRDTEDGNTLFEICDSETDFNGFLYEASYQEIVDAYNMRDDAKTCGYLSLTATQADFYTREKSDLK